MGHGDGDTSLGGGGRAFPKTEQELLQQIGSGRPDGLEELARRYWKPVYTVARVAWRKSNEDAKDLTQAFFLWLADEGALRAYAPARGRFRAYLRSLLKHFLQHQDAALRSLKRGGGVRLLPIDADPGLLSGLAADPGDADPEKAFEQGWRRSLIAGAVERVRRRLDAAGQGLKYRAFQAYDLPPPSERPTYRRLAEELGVKETDVTNWLSDVRGEIRAEIRAEIDRSSATPEEAEEEWRAFLGP